MKNLGLETALATESVTVADFVASKYMGTFTKESMLLLDSKLDMNYLVMIDLPFDEITGFTTLEELQVCIDPG